MTLTTENRQRLTGHNEEERSLREDDTRGLIHDIIGRHAEFFSDPTNRLEFIQSQSADEFFNLARYINAKLRSEKPHQMRLKKEGGGYLPMRHTPAEQDKPEAFRRGFEAIQEYLGNTDDAIDKKIEGAAMASEALVIWVHPFNDGNGRTSRFMAKLIEDGATDIDELVSQTSSNMNRGRIYSDTFATKEGALADANNKNIMFEDEEEREALRVKAQGLPSSVDAIYLSIKRLLEDDSIRENSLRHVRRMSEIRK